MKIFLRKLNFFIVYHYLNFIDLWFFIKAKVLRKRIIYSHFSRVNNFGDMFNKDLVRYFNAELIYTPYYYKSEMVLTGSILGAYLRDYSGYVLGSGFIADRYNREGNNWNVKIIRGPLSAKQCNAQGDFVFGDPGILASRIYNIKPFKKYKIGILPHSKDVEFVKSLKFNKDVLFIHPRRKPKEVAKDILKCENIASSSLHGLIFSDSFGIPNIHLKFGEKLIGGFHKFNDYYLGMDSKPEVLRYDKKITIQDIINKCKLRISNEYMEHKQNELILIFKSILP